MSRLDYIGYSNGGVRAATCADIDECSETCGVTARYRCDCCGRPLCSLHAYECPHDQAACSRCWRQLPPAFPTTSAPPVVLVASGDGRGTSSPF